MKLLEYMEQQDTLEMYSGQSGSKVSPVVKLPKLRNIVRVLLPICTFFLWSISLKAVDIHRMSDLGLVSVLPPSIIIALLILTISFCLTLRQLWLYLHNCTNMFRDRLRVLHFAPEVIIQKRLRACPNLDYTSADLDSPFAMVRMDITQIPYAENTVDIILCSHVLEHIPDDHKAMTELYRILKPGGWAIIQVPIIDPERAETFEAPEVVDPRERYRLFGQADHVRIYGRDFKNRLERAGFTVQQNFYARELGPALTQRYGLLEEEDMFYCTKPT